jgi:hypothetical protein
MPAKSAAPIDLSSLTNGKLIKVLEKRDADRSAATDAVFGLAISHDERFCSILSRLGEYHPTVAAYERASRAMSEAKAEAARRVGPVQFDMLSTYIIYLENQKSRRKQRSAA